MRAAASVVALILAGACNTVLGLDETVASKDHDEDGVIDGVDNCRDVANTDQADGDGDGVGDACDPCVDGAQTNTDADADGLDDGCDPCPLGPNHDEDGDGLYDACDNCPELAAPQTNSDGDDFGDACDDDALAQHRVLFDGFGPPDPRWVPHALLWEAADDAVAPPTMPSAGDRGLWIPTVKTASAWTIDTAFTLPAQPATNDVVGLFADSPDNTAMDCMLSYIVDRWYLVLGGVTNAIPQQPSGRVRMRFHVHGTMITCEVFGIASTSAAFSGNQVITPSLYTVVAKTPFYYVDLAETR